MHHGEYPHLTVQVWDALARMADSNAAMYQAALAVLATTPPENQQSTARQWIDHELAELLKLRQREATPQLSKKSEVVKLDVTRYSGEGTHHRLALNRWLCEVDIAIQARQLSTELARTHFLISKLDGRAKEWALGRLVADPHCFPPPRR